MKKEKEERRGMGNRARTLRPASSPSVATAGGGYAVRVLSDCITSYDQKKIPEILTYYASKGCTVESLAEAMA